jgi:hypothetical protein
MHNMMVNSSLIGQQYVTTTKDIVLAKNWTWIKENNTVTNQRKSLLTFVASSFFVLEMQRSCFDILGWMTSRSCFSYFPRSFVWFWYPFKALILGSILVFNFRKKLNRNF